MSKTPPSENEPLVKKEEADRSKEGKAKNFLILIYSILLLTAAVGNSIFFKKMTNKMPNYAYFLSQLTTIMYVPFFMGIVVYERLYTNYITEAMLNMPKRKFFWIGAFDSLAGICMLFGGVHTSGSTQSLLANAVIPVTMILSFTVLGTRFKFGQYIGAATILAGVIVVILPKMTNGGGGGDQVLFNFIFLVSVLPTALSAVWKEALFSTTDIDVNYLQAWVAIWQLLFGLLMIPLNTLSFLGPNSMSWSDLPYALLNGGKCLFGLNTIVANCYHANDVVLAGLPACDSCHGAASAVFSYLLFNINYNIFVVLVIKYGGASLMYIIMTLRLPVVQLAFSFSWINDPPDAFPWTSVLGLLLILLGLSAYRFSSLEKPKEGEEAIVPFVGENALPIAIKRPVMQHLRRSGAQIRGGFYSKLGVIGSPVTPHSPRRSPKYSSPSKAEDSSALTINVKTKVKTSGRNSTVAYSYGSNSEKLDAH